MERDDPSFDANKKTLRKLRKEREETVCDSSKMMISLSPSSSAQPGEKGSSSNVATGLLSIRSGEQREGEYAPASPLEFGSPEKKGWFIVVLHYNKSRLDNSLSLGPAK